MTFYKNLLEVGFTDINVIVGIMSDSSEVLRTSFSDDSLKPTGYFDDRNDWEKIKAFFSYMIENKGEAILRKTIFVDCDERLLNDTSRMFSAFSKAGILKKSYFKGSLKEIHDNLSKDYKK